jgi:DNA polymerase III delta prime subunit
MQSNIILTSTTIDLFKLKTLIAQCFFENPNLTILDITKTFNQHKKNISYTTLLSKVNVIDLDFNEKKDFKKTILGLWQVRERPTILFLGDLEKYSLSLQEGMLKLLEEPPENIYIYLFSRTADSILPTIKSRSRLIFLPTEIVYEILDKEILVTANEKLGSPKNIIIELLKSDSKSTVANISKIERNEINFWLWQIVQNLVVIFEQKPSSIVAKKIKQVLLAIKYNNDNVQKKFVIETIYS